jgi:4-alpha-glucanotransferase
VYVRYPAEELAAVLAIESHRAGCEVAGEDLGTVAPELRRLMERRGMRRSYVLAFGFPERLGEDPDPVPPGSVATIETHDMYPFAALLDGGDVRDRVALGLLPEARAPTELEERARRVRALLAALPGPDDDPVTAALTWLGRSAARLVLAPIDDLVSSREPHNVPGTTGERPNWRRRLDVRLDELRADERVSRRVAALRRGRAERAERSS